MKPWTIGLACACLTVSSAYGESALTSVSSVGSAALDVSPDQIEVVFELVTERNSFAEAASAAEATVARLRKVSLPAEGVSIAVEYDVTFMKQMKWSRGRKLEHRFRATLDHVPDGAVQRVLVRFIDSALELEPGMTVERFATSLSAAKRKEVQAKVLQEAVANAHLNAVLMAEAAGLSLESARTVSPGGSAGRGPGELDLESRWFENVGLRFPASMAFTAHGDSLATIRVPMVVSVTFNAAAR